MKGRKLAENSPEFEERTLLERARPYHCQRVKMFFEFSSNSTAEKNTDQKKSEHCTLKEKRAKPR